MQKITSFLLLLIFFVSTQVGSLSAQGQYAYESGIAVSLTSEHTAIRPGENFWVALYFDVHEPWHCHGLSEDESAGPDLHWTLPPGFTVLDVSTPTPSSYEAEQQTAIGFNSPFTILANIQASDILRPGDIAVIAVDANWVSCNGEICMPGFITKMLQVPMANEATLADASIQSFFAKARSNFQKDQELVAMGEEQKPPSFKDPDLSDSFEFEGGLIMALVFAFLGGLLLNLMPCVLPVISFKVLSFVKMASQQRSTTLRHGCAFALGVLISFWVLAALLLILQAYGNAVGWGFQLQEPLFVGVLAVVMLIFGLSMFGVFEFGAFFASWVGTQSGQSRQEGLFSSFSSGVLATAVATPCTGPFLGSAIGFAVTLPPIQSLLIFTSLGFGMASPYLLFAGFPQFLRFMPKPGAWMETFKQFMGFVMLASTLWLVWVFGFQTDVNSQALMLLGLFIISMACWIYGRWGALHKKRRTRLFSLLTSLILIGLGGQLIVSAANISNEGSSQITYGEWEKFDPERVEKLQQLGIPVFVDFTAKWCLICQANHLVLSMEDISLEMKQHGIIKMKADWTKNDPMITAYLKKYGRNGVPLYLFFNGREEEQPQILPQILTKESIFTALSTISSPVAERD